MTVMTKDLGRSLKSSCKALGRLSAMLCNADNVQVNINTWEHNTVSIRSQDYKCLFTHLTLQVNVFKQFLGSCFLFPSARPAFYRLLQRKCHFIKGGTNSIRTFVRESTQFATILEFSKTKFRFSSPLQKSLAFSSLFRSDCALTSKSLW